MKIDLKPEKIDFKKPEIIDFKKPEIVIPIAIIFFAIIFVIYKMFFEKNGVNVPTQQPMQQQLTQQPTQQLTQQQATQQQPTQQPTQQQHTQQQLTQQLTQQQATQQQPTQQLTQQQATQQQPTQQLTQQQATQQQPQPKLQVQPQQPQPKLQVIKTPLDLIKYYSSNNVDHFIDNEEIINLYETFLTKLPIGLKNLIICDNNALDNKDYVYNIVKCIKGQMYWWWLDNAYGQTVINIDDINIVMLIIIWLLIMIEENKTTVKEIMIYDETTNKVTLISDNLKKLFEESDQYRRQNNHVLDIMNFHAIFKQYMFKSKDIKKTICDCKNQSISLTQTQIQEIEAHVNLAQDLIIQAKRPGNIDLSSNLNISKQQLVSVSSTQIEVSQTPTTIQQQTLVSPLPTRTLRIMPSQIQVSQTSTPVQILVAKN